MAKLGPGNLRAWRGMLVLAAFIAILVACSVLTSRFLPRCSSPDTPPALPDSIARLDSMVRARASADSALRAGRRAARRAFSRPPKSSAPRRPRRPSVKHNATDSIILDSPHNHPVKSH